MNDTKILEAKVPYLLYYSTMYELQSNKLKVINLKGFSYKSIDESLLWQSNFKVISSQISNTFYCALEEMRFIYNEIMAYDSDSIHSDNKFASLTIRCSILGAILFHSGTSLIYDEIKKIDRNLYQFLTLCNSLSEQFLAEFRIDNYALLTSSLHGFADIYTKSDFLKKTHVEGERLFELIEKTIKNKVLDKFFSPFEYLENSLVGILSKTRGKELFEAIAFKDSVLWVSTYGESSFLSYCFLDKHKITSVSMLESIRLVLKSDRYSLSETRVRIFREAFASYILVNSNNEQLKTSLMQSQNIEILRKKFWLANNKRRITESLYSMSSVIGNVFDDFKKNIIEKKQEDAYHILFANIYNGIENLLLENNCIYPEPFLEEERDEMAKLLSDKIVEIVLKDING